MPVYFNDALDDVPVYDACPSFEGGMVSAFEAKLLQTNQVADLQNMDISTFGTLTTRRGTTIFGTESAKSYTVQGLQWFNIPALQLVIRASNGALQSWNGSAWNALSGYTPANATGNVEFAQLNNVLVVTDGVNDPYSWTGSTWNDIGPGTFSTSVSRARNNSGVATIITSAPHNIVNGGLMNATGFTDATFDVSQVVATVNNSTSVSYACPGSLVNTTSDTNGTLNNANRCPVASAFLSASYRLFAYPIISTGQSNTGVMDGFAISDVLNPGSWLPANQLRVGMGEGDPLVAMVPWDATNIIALKNNSIWIIDADPSVSPSNWTIGAIHREIGCVARRTACQVGADVWFLAKDGVRSVQRIETQNQNEVEDIPVSNPIQDWIQRINWQYASAACAVFWNNRYIISFPIDSSTTNNYTFVFNTATQSWSGYWTGWNPTIYEKTYFPTQEKRLCFGQTDGRVWQWLDYINTQSELPANYTDNGVAIPSSLTTRSMIFNEATSAVSFSPAVLNDKKGLYYEMEFNNSVATVTANIITNQGQIYASWTGGSQPQTVILPLGLPFTLEASGSYKKALDLFNYAPFRELQIQVSATGGKVALRRVVAAAFVDTFNLQS